MIMRPRLDCDRWPQVGPFSYRHDWAGRVATWQQVAGSNSRWGPAPSSALPEPARAGCLTQRFCRYHRTYLLPTRRFQGHPAMLGAPGFVGPVQNTAQQYGAHHGTGLSHKSCPWWCYSGIPASEVRTRRTELGDIPVVVKHAIIVTKGRVYKTLW
jgi:hypothetical protein